MDLVLDIGNFRLKGAYFEGDEILDFFTLPLDMTLLEQKLKKVDRCLISSVNTPLNNPVKDLIEKAGNSFQLLDFSTVKISLDVEEPEAVGQDRIANVYGALFRFPHNDTIVVDIGTAVTFDYVGRGGKYLGGAIYPGMTIGAKALHAYTDLLPEVEIEKPKYAVAKTTKTHIQSGLYWGLLGAIERITSEMRRLSDAPSNVMVIATGGGAAFFAEDLQDIVDLIDPALTLIGVHEILKEKI